MFAIIKAYPEGAFPFFRSQNPRNNPLHHQFQKTKKLQLRFHKTINSLYVNENSSVCMKICEMGSDLSSWMQLNREKSCKTLEFWCNLLEIEDKWKTRNCARKYLEFKPKLIARCLVQSCGETSKSLAQYKIITLLGIRCRSFVVTSKACILL